MSQPPVTPGPPPSYNPQGGEMPPQQPYSAMGTSLHRRKKRSSAPWIVGGLVAIVLVCCGGFAIIGALSDDPATETTGVAGAGSTTAPASTATTRAAEPAAASAPAKTTPAKPAPKVTYKPLTERQWKLVAKNPDKYIGKTYIVYGVVFQFDAATGDDRFLASVGHKNMQYEFEYDTNTMLSASASKLTNVVDGDEFRATVKVVGSYSYDTQIGGNTTVPMLAISTIKVL